jgi:hypothetical protein
MVMHRRLASVVMADPVRRGSDVLTAWSRRRRLGDRVTRRSVRHDVGQGTDRDEGGRGHPPVDSPQTDERGVAREVGSVAPHPWW